MMTPQDALASFVGKWHQRQPEMALLDAFCPPPQRRRMHAWGALTHELSETLWTTSDAGVARTKLAWWERDLSAGASGSQHPIARALLAEAGGEVPATAWRRLLTAAIDLGEASREAGAVPEAEARAFGERLAEVETVLFALPSDADAVTVDLRLVGMQHGIGDGAVDRDLIRELVGQLPPPGRQNLFRNGRTAFDRWRLQRLQRGASLADVQRIPPLRALLLGWSAARRSRATG